MEREGFVFYRSFLEAVKGLDDSTRLQCLDAIVDYGIYGEEKDLSGIPKMVFTLIKPQIDANNKRYEDGKKGGRPKKTTGFENENHRFLEKKPKEKEKDKDKEKEKDKEKDKEKETVKEKRKDTLTRYQDLKLDYPLSENMDSTLSDWFSYRDRIKKPLKDDSIIQLINKTMDLESRYGYLSVKACFDNSMENGYQGVFFDKIKAAPRDNKSEVDDFFRRELGI